MTEPCASGYEPFEKVESKADKWQPIDEWCEEDGDVTIVFFNHRGELWGSLLSSPISSDYPVHTHGLVGYFKRVDSSDLPTPPKEQEND